jgi:hypothetical protein
MASWAWVVVAIAAAAVIVSMAAMFAFRRRSRVLQGNFGPEYDRTLAHSQGRREAESELRRRQAERQGLDIRPLPVAAQLRYVEEWQGIQGRFIDEPLTAVASADHLLRTVMEARGYPVADFESNAALISVDHPALVENYRVANDVYERSRMNQATTEELRDSLLRYRALFDELLRSADDGVTLDEAAHLGEPAPAYRLGA